MFIVIRNDAKLSLKAQFFLELLSDKSNIDSFVVYKTEKGKFKETWNVDSVQLSSSIPAIIMNFLTVFFRSPAELREAFLRRLFLKKFNGVIGRNGFLPALRRTLYIYFGTSGRTKRLFSFISSQKKPLYFVVDEFFSIKAVELKDLKRFGPIIYISQDIAHNRYDFDGNLLARTLMLRLERNAVESFDLIVACSERERLEYLEMGAKRAIFYPNIYPTKRFEPGLKDNTPSISIVLRDHWGSQGSRSLVTIFNALALLNIPIKVYMMGVKPEFIPKNVILEYRNFLPSKNDYLTVLSRSWFGLNIGIHKAGTNERKYDYAEAGSVVFSDQYGARGDFLPYEYSFIDSYDLAAKLEQLLLLGKNRISEMGIENRRHILLTAEKARCELIDCICKITSCDSDH